MAKTIDKTSIFVSFVSGQWSVVFYFIFSSLIALLRCLLMTVKVTNHAFHLCILSWVLIERQNERSFSLICQFVFVINNVATNVLK